MLCNACNVMHHSPPYVHAHITSTPYSLHTLGQLFLQTSVRPPPSCHTSRYLILLIFGQKLEGDKLNVTAEPDFPKKILNDPKLRKTVFLTIPLIFW